MRATARVNSTSFVTTTEKEHVMRWGWLVIGAAALLAGIIWTLQGLDILRGSVMSGDHAYVVVGPIVGAIGLALLAVGVRRRAGGA
jgi:hypothetical protein